MLKVLLLLTIACVNCSEVVFPRSIVGTETVTVVTNKGEIVGNKNDGYDTYFGVPYAKVDEDNPFGSSMQYPHFEKPFIANDSSIMCPQVIRKVGGILQCLRLNIYVPQPCRLYCSNDSIPVLVWFHGGGFVLGNAGEYGGQYLVKHHIIVVTVNYRLGPYGFLCLNDPNVPGNQGLKDQVTALRWVIENIQAFGGDPKQVTIAGESYGGGAVDFHLYANYEKLFDKAIIQSGSMFTPYIFVKRDNMAPIKLAKNLGYKVNKTRDALRILTKVSPVNVMAAARNISLKLGVCKEISYKGVQNFINKYPLQLNNTLKINQTKILFGYNSKEDFGTFANKSKEFYDELGNIFYNNLKNNFYLRKRDLDAISNITKIFYLGGKSIRPETMLEMSDYSSDFKLNYAAEKSVTRLVEQGAIVYKYLFSYIGGSIYQNISGAGAIHTEELKYLFDMGADLATEEQMTIRDKMTAMWTNFIKYGSPTCSLTEGSLHYLGGLDAFGCCRRLRFPIIARGLFGNPTPPTSMSDLLPIEWVPIKGSARPYLDIDVEMTMKDYVYNKRIAFWELLWRGYRKKSMTYS